MKRLDKIIEDLKASLEEIESEKEKNIPGSFPKEQINPELEKWKNINSKFTNNLIEIWKSKDFTYIQVKEWIDVGFNIVDCSLVHWIRNYKKKTAEWCLNYGNIEELRKEYRDWVFNS